METDVVNKKNEPEALQGKKKRTWGSWILNFMMMGGIFVVLIVFIAIVFLVSYLTK